MEETVREEVMGSDAVVDLLIFTDFLAESLILTSLEYSNPGLSRGIWISWEYLSNDAL